MTDRVTRRRVVTTLGASLAIAGCVGGKSDNDTDGETDETDSAEGSEQTGDTTSESSDTMSDGDSTNADLPEWHTIQLEDVTTGEQFTLAQIDEPVVIHTFATYCPTCNDQQDKLAAGYSDLSEQATLLDLSIDENDNVEDVRSHAEANNLEWRFGIAPNELTSALVDEFGQEVAFYSQSPLMIICPGGETDTVPKGSEASEITDAITNLCG
jgi:cytochrome oxidase Cu insertion factor (SCO1/SenC/PrrC family)